MQDDPHSRNRQWDTGTPPSTSSNGQQPHRGGHTASTRATFHLPTELVEELRDTVWHLSGPPERATVAAVVRRGIRAELDRLQQRYNSGRPFPRRGGELLGPR
jgi:hypothetical protein